MSPDPSISLSSVGILSFTTWPDAEVERSLGEAAPERPHPPLIPFRPLFDRAADDQARWEEIARENRVTRLMLILISKGCPQDWARAEAETLIRDQDFGLPH